MARSRHGVLGTLNATRGVDAVPVVFAIEDRRIVLPVDTVKAKRSPRLQRAANLESDPRCVLLVDEYNDDWSRLWWVRVHAHGFEAAPTDRQLSTLAKRYPQYRAPDVVRSVIVLTPHQIAGWSAEIR